MDNSIKRTKKAIFEAFNGQIRKSQIVKRDGEYVVRGRSCIISRKDDGSWDVWICNPERPDMFLGPRSVTNRVNRLKKHAQEGSLNEGEGEAWLSVDSVDFIAQDISLCNLLGIKRKRRMSDAQMRELALRFRGTKKASAA